MDQRNKKRLESTGPLIAASQETAAQDMYNANVMQLSDDKFQCFLCGKLFRGFEFVVKHINGRHPEKLQEAKDEVYISILPAAGTGGTVARATKTNNKICTIYRYSRFRVSDALGAGDGEKLL
jgi:hypothetical protein